MVKLLKLIISLGLLIFTVSCSKQTVMINQSTMDWGLSFLIENDSLHYDTSFDDQNILIQKVNFKIINHTDKTYVLPFESSFFSTYKDVNSYLEGSQYIINRNQAFTPFIQIISEDGEVGSADPIMSDIESDCKSLINEFPQLIIIEPHGYKNFAIEFSMPFYKVNCFYTTHTQSSFYDNTTLFTPNGVGSIFVEISYPIINWEKAYNKRTINEMKKKGIVLFEGTILSNKIPIVPR